MSVITRMIFKETLGLSVFNLFLFSLLTSFLIANRYLRMDLGMTDLMDLFPLFLMSSLAFALPLAASLSAAQATARWKFEGELNSFFAAGIPVWKLIRPLTLCGLLAGALCIPLYHNFIPNSQAQLMNRSTHLLSKIFIAQARTGIPMVLPSTNSRLFSGGVEGEWLKDLVLTRQNSDETVILKAERGRIVEAGGRFYLDCHGIETDRFAESGLSSTFPRDRIPLNIRNRQNKEIDQEMTVPTYQLGHSGPEILARHNRWINCLLIPLMLWLGFHLGLLSPRPEKPFVFLFSLLPILVYYLSLIASQALTEDPSPYIKAVGSWLPVFLLLIGGGAIRLVLAKRGIV